MAVYERLHRLADGRGKEVRVVKSELRKLLVDHTRLLTKLRDEGYNVE
jgi:hypothetical protein